MTVREIRCPVCGGGAVTPFWQNPRLADGHNCAYVRCTACGTLYVTPRCEDVEYYVNLPSSYLNPIQNYFPNVSIPGFLFLLDQMEARWFRLAPHRGRLLEIGSAVGYFLSGARARGWEVKGVEPAKEAAEWGRKYLQLDIEACTLNAAELPLGHFDVVVAIEVLEHLLHPSQDLQRMRSWLKPGGLAFLTTPNAESPEYALRNDSSPILDPRDHLTLFHPGSLKTFLIASGLRDVEVATTGGAHGDIQLLSFGVNA